jgi:hypothetical protein
VLGAIEKAANIGGDFFDSLLGIASQATEPVLAIIEAIAIEGIIPKKSGFSC